MMTADFIKQLIEQHLSQAQVSVKGDDGSHFDAVVVCADFQGKTTVKRHQMVYAALGERMQNNDIHALGLKTYTPDEWAALR